MAEVSNVPRREEFDPEDESDLHPSNIDDFASLCLHNDIWSPLSLELDDQEPENPEFEYAYPVWINSTADLLEEALLTDDPFPEPDPFGVEEDSGSDFGIGSRRGYELPLLGIDSASVSEEFEVNSRITSDDIVDDDSSYVGFRVHDDISQVSGNEREEFEWEEVNERIHFEDRETLNYVDQIEEISVSADVMSEGENPNLSEEDEQANIGWEVLLAMDDLERSIGLDFTEENSHFEVPRIHLPENYILTVEHDALFSHLVTNNALSNGRPPAAKSAVDNLPVVILTNEELWSCDEVVCAVCKDEVAIGEKATRMPCCHLFHRECILPWLRIENTCPVCRYELPTDDVDYERRKSARGGRNGPNGSVHGLR